MEDERLRALAILGERATRRGIVAGVAGVAGLHLGAVAAKRRHRGSCKRGGQDNRQLSAAAADPAAITIVTEGAEGSHGTFTASGAIEDKGTFAEQSVHFSAAGAPTFFIVHVTFLFEGLHGAFTLRSQHKITLTAPPLFTDLTGEGAWAILSGAGAYERLHAQGKVSGEIHENVEPSHVFTYTGKAHIA